MSGGVRLYGRARRQGAADAGPGVRRVVSSVALIACLAAAGCGKGGAAPATAPEARATAGGEAPQPEVKQSARAAWDGANAAFVEGEAKGFSATLCAEASSGFAKVVAEAPELARAEYMLGLTAARCGDDAAAKAAYERALKKDPALCPARVGVGLFELKAGDRDAAKATFERAIKADPQCTTGYVDLAVVQREGSPKERDEALDNLRRALAIESGYLPAFNEMALLYFARGKGKGDEASLDLAEIVCRQAQIVDDKYAPIYNTWGLIKIYRGDVIAALRLFERAIELDKSFFEAEMNFAEVAQSFRGYADAREGFARAHELRPDNYEAIIGLGAALRGLRRYDEARAEYERAIALDPARPEAYFNLGLLYQDYMQGQVAQLEKAKSYYGDFLERSKGDAALAQTREDLTRRCATAAADRRGKTSCRPGRLQVIDQTLAALREVQGTKP
ncbi:MAG: tetratricopeptide repeat protein [Myxococcales bacterium]|nr:tetratricopeptide repeat protein [Myxococcales bacterium]